jgi:MFS family permease
MPAETNSPTHAIHDPYSALRIVDCRRLIVANLVSSLGMQMQTMVVGYDLYARTGSAMSLGWVGLVEFLPVVLLVIPAGHAADKYDRRRIIILAQSLMMVASLGMGWLSWTKGSIPLIYVCLGLTGIASSMLRPSRASLLPGLVPAEHLQNAVTWNTSGLQVASVAGPALGGLLIYLTGQPAALYLLDALCGLSVVVMISRMKARFIPGAAKKASMDSLLAGFRFVRDTKLILASITLDLFAVLLGGATALLPIFARDILKVDARGFGLLRAAPAVGALVMAMILAHRPPMRHAGRALLGSVAGFGLATVVFGLSRNPILSFAMLLFVGALDNVSMVVRSTLVQTLTPDSMRGRVSAVNSLFIGSSNELGAFESGLTARLFGPVASVVGGGIGTLLVVFFADLQWPQIRRLARLSDALPPSALAELSEIPEPA